MTRMAWTAEDRRKYAPAIQEVLRQGMIVRYCLLHGFPPHDCLEFRPAPLAEAAGNRQRAAEWQPDEHASRDHCLW